MHSSMPQASREDARTSRIPAVPLTLEGSSVLHRMLRFDSSRWRSLTEDERNKIADEASYLLGQLERGGASASALFSLLGHKGDLMLLHYRNSFEELKAAELRLATV